MDPFTLSLDEFIVTARAWLNANAKRRDAYHQLRWGEGSDNVAVFATLTHDQERQAIDDALGWQRQKADAGYGSISWAVEHGGAGLTRQHEDAFRRLEREYDTPPNHEAVGISLNIESPTILTLGTDEQRKRWLGPIRRGDLLCCQLFSEPGAGSDLGALSMKAERDGDDWVVNGQKVWTTGAQFADIGYVICRTDADAPRQTGCTAFVLEMDTPGVEIRPLQQMTGGNSFNEVFFTDVRIPDANRLGEVGAGWHAAMTTLGFERVAGAGGGGGGTATVLDLLILAARQYGRDQDPIVRQELARSYAMAKVRTWTNRRSAAATRQGGVPGPGGSIGKLAYTNGLTQLGHAAALVLGHRVVADTGEWGTYSWGELITGAPGMRIAGGTDEIQRNTIAERVLGLPREPR